MNDVKPKTIGVDQPDPAAASWSFRSVYANSGSVGQFLQIARFRDGNRKTGEAVLIGRHDGNYVSRRPVPAKIRNSIFGRGDRD
ncbi:MAG TPA: hypothetical protein VN325_19865 [Steroidobacteraceae bacterium]|nr:hypothetical protein [Steroidobacteraceae bacterium]